MTNEAAVAWTKWSQYQSSFSLMLVPHCAGVFALAEEVVSPSDASKRMLALVSVTEADDLARMISSMFHASTDVQRRMGELKLFIRYAVIDDSDQRRAVAATLNLWIQGVVQAATGVVENFVAEPEPNKEAVLESEIEGKGFAGLPSLPAVARLMALTSRMPASIAAVNQFANCLIGSGSRSRRRRPWAACS